MKKALGQTVRDLKRGVNRNVLKVPSIEQKVLDATSNEPWGPHGSVLADIALATRNYHEYQMIMSVMWKRINDTGKNWRHVYKALTVLEYLVGHGAERVIDDIREHAYQISTLSDFQYIDSRGRDQGNNVRKKSQSLVVLVNDKERIQEVREKAAANREKYRNTSGGSMYRPASGGYLDRYDDRYDNRDEGRNGYGDSYGRDGYRDDDYRGRSPNTNDYQYGSRSRSADRDRDRAYEDDGQYSSRGSGAKTDDHSQDGSTTSKGLERRFSEQNLSAPPSYEEAVGAAIRSPTFSERNGESPVTSSPKASSPTHVSLSHANVAVPPNIPALSSPPASAAGEFSQKQEDDFDEFDPRGSFSAAPTIQNGTAPATSGYGEMDLLGSLSESFSSNSLALVLAEPTITSETNASGDFGSGPTFAAAPSTSTFSNQPFDDPFGDSPFKAMPSGLSDVHPPTNPQFTQHEISTPNHEIEIDILADILPPAAPSSSSFGNTQIDYAVSSGQSFSHAQFPPQTNEPAPHSYPTGRNAQENNFQVQPGQHSLHASYPIQSSELVPQTGYMSQSNALTFPVQASHIGVHSQSGQAQAGFPSQMGFGGQSAQPNPNPNFYGVYQQNNFLSQSAPQASQMAPPAQQVQSSLTMGSQVSAIPDLALAIVPQPSNDKFETKSTVWADTLSRGLVNLNISGSKTNPLANIGVDFDAINRREKRMEKPTTTTATSTINMGKAMGSGSGMGRAGAGAMRPQQNQMMGPGMNYGPPGMNMGGYGANQPMGPGNMGMGMNMGMGQGGAQMQQQVRFPPGQAQNMPGGYNPMMGSGNYGQQQYGAGYR